MTASLTPDLALAYVRELSADIRAAVLLDAHGQRLAGPDALAAAARELLGDTPGELEARTDAGVVFAARDRDHQLVAVTGPFALPGLTRHDLRTVLRALGGAEIGAGPRGAPIEAPREAVEAILEAVRGRR
jgi:hypothetical protein